MDTSWLDISSTVGLIATGVLTFNILLGMALSTAYKRSTLWKRLPPVARRVSLDDLHNWTAYVALALALAHPLLLLPDAAAKFTWLDIVFPLHAPHQATWVWLGTIALYALIVVIVTTQKVIKRKMSFRAWKNIHLVSYVTALLFVIHGVVMDPELKDRPVDFFDAEKVLSEVCAVILIAATVARYRYYRKRQTG